MVQAAALAAEGADRAINIPYSIVLYMQFSIMYCFICNVAGQAEPLVSILRLISSSELGFRVESAF